MGLKTLLILLIFVFQISHKEKNYILWTDASCLSWKDFESKPDKEEKVLKSYGKLNIYFTIENLYEEKINYNVESQFLKDESWTLTKSKLNLINEQIRFNIVEITSRIIRKYIWENSRNYINDRYHFKLKIDSLLYEKDYFLDEYDIDSDFGRDSMKVMKWEEKTKRLLSKFYRFEKPNGMIILQPK